jgi:predicted esterase
LTTPGETYYIHPLLSTGGIFVTLKGASMSRRLMRAGLVAALAFSLQAQVEFAQQPDQQAPRGGGQRGRVDPRVLQRTYVFKETNEFMPFTLFASSKVRKDKKNPLIVALHGLGGDQNTMVRESFRAVELAEQGGYILVAPMGYNSGGWYGIPPGAPRGGGGRGAPNGANPAGAPQRGAGAGRGGATPPPPPAGGTAVTDVAKVRELSEKDVLNVLDMIRKEFNVDEHRTYLMGHSMGGAGTLYLGVKYPANWAAIAAIAPAAFQLNPDSLASIKDMPVIIVQGDADTAVPVANTRRWADKLKELKMTHEYHEIAGGDHGSVIATGMPDIFAFFAKHTR